MVNRVNMRENLIQLMDLSYSMMAVLQENTPLMCPSCVELKRQLADRDRVVEYLRSQTSKLQSELTLSSQLCEQLSEKLRIADSQLVVFKSDFNLEREDRANVHGELDRVKIELDASVRAQGQLFAELQKAQTTITSQQTQLNLLLDEQLRSRHDVAARRRRADVTRMGFDTPDVLGHRLLPEAMSSYGSVKDLGRRAPLYEPDAATGVLPAIDDVDLSVDDLDSSRHSPLSFDDIDIVVNHDHNRTLRFFADVD